MREVDQALARAYAQRDATEHAAVPPAPHFEVESDATPRAEHEIRALHWPTTVRALEREFGGGSCGWPTP